MFAAAILGSISGSLVATNRHLFSRSFNPRLYSTSLLPRRLAASLSLKRPCTSFSTQAATAQPSQDVTDNHNEAAEKLGFEKVSEQFIEEWNSNAVLYKHKKTGAEVMSLSNDDENKVFGICFRTPPTNSTGIPHILEHSVLCGSRKYPLKNPLALLEGSSHTFHNAITFPDRTCYPVASRNTKDFYSMVDIYLDAVFFPKCVEDCQIFQQQGWHYELNNHSEDISLQGVVLNEMKGKYSKPLNVINQATKQALFPDNAYAFDSGGNPKEIPKLTFDEFKEFHRKYYHPSNSRIWFYGDGEPNERLGILSEYLNLFDATSVSIDSKVLPQKLFSKPVRIIQKYPAGESDVKGVVLNWLLSENPLDLQTELAIGILENLFFQTPASPFRKILVESGLGDSPIGKRFSEELLQPTFGFGLKGVFDKNVPKVEELIMTTLQKFVEEGFHSDNVEASLNSFEFLLRECDTGSFPLGLSLMLLSMKKWIHGMDPFKPLKYKKPLEELKGIIARAGAKAVFSPLIEKFFLNNTHCVTVEMQPDPKMISRYEEEEKATLKKLKACMSHEDLAELARATQKLRLKQETPDPRQTLNCVPSLSLKDIPKSHIHVPIEVGEINGVKVLKHDLFTNDILYADVVFDMSSVRQELLPMVPLFCCSLPWMGTKHLDFVQLNQLIRSKTGGITMSSFISPVYGEEDLCSHIIVRGKSMAGHTEDLFNLVNVILQEVQYTDKYRFKQIVTRNRSEMEGLVRGSGHKVAGTRMDAKLNVAGWVSEQMGGVSYLEFLRGVEQIIDYNWPRISQGLEEIRRSILSRKHCVVNITADGKNLANAVKYVSKFLDLLPSNSPQEKSVWKGRLHSANEALVIPTQVNYVGKAANIYDTGYKLKGSAHVISKHINSWLWDQVRVSGGAYGGFCNFNPHSGVFSFMSYMDPNLLKTLDVYDKTGKFLRDLKMDDYSLNKAIIATIGDVDSYQLPNSKGYSSLLQYLRGGTEEGRRIRREEILSTRVNDFKEFADAIDAIKEKGVVVAVASSDAVKSANKERPDFFRVTEAL